MAHKHATGSSRLLALLAALWLNLAIQPCATAYGGPGEHDCPHCPSVSDHAMPSHHAHGDDVSSPSCATMEATCGTVDDASYDGRGGQLKLKDAPQELFALGGTCPFDPRAPLPHGRTLVADPGSGPRASPSLNVLYCVFLD